MNGSWDLIFFLHRSDAHLEAVADLPEKVDVDVKAQLADRRYKFLNALRTKRSLSDCKNVYICACIQSESDFVQRTKRVAINLGNTILVQNRYYFTRVLLARMPFLSHCKLLSLSWC